MNVYLAVQLAIELMCKRCELMQKQVDDLMARVSSLEGEVRRLALPDYLPDKVKIDDWKRVRELDHREREIELEARRSSLEGRGRSEGYEERLERARENGFSWPTRNGVEPSRLSTRERMLKEWEEQFSQAKDLPDSDLLNVQKITRIGPGAIQVAVNRLVEKVGDEVDVDGLNLYNTYQKLAKAVKDCPSLLSPPPDYTSDAELLRERVYGNSLSPEQKEVATRLFRERIEAVDGLTNLTPDLIKQCCNLERLPVFIPWDPLHINASTRLMGIKSGQYDGEFKALVESL